MRQAERKGAAPGFRVSVWRDRLRAVSMRYSVGPLVSLLAALGVRPNHLTIAGFLGSVGAAVAVGYGRFLLGGAVFLAASLLDMLDGSLARQTKRASSFGAFLDSTLDRLSEIALFIGLLVFFANAGARTEQVLVLLALSSSFLVSYLRARAEGLGLTCDVGILTRTERVAILGIGLLVDQTAIALWIVTVLGLYTAAQRFVHVWRQLPK